MALNFNSTGSGSGPSSGRAGTGLSFKRTGSGSRPSSGRAGTGLSKFVSGSPSGRSTYIGSTGLGSGVVGTTLQPVTEDGPNAFERAHGENSTWSDNVEAYYVVSSQGERTRPSTRHGGSRFGGFSQIVMPSYAIDQGNGTYLLPARLVTGGDRKTFGLDSDSSTRVLRPSSLAKDGGRQSWPSYRGSNATPASWEEGYESKGNTSEWGYADGGLVADDVASVGPEGESPDMLIEMVIMALDQDSPMPMEERKAVILEFLTTYGREELKALMVAIEREEGMADGGVGPTDTVPAMLTPGEFVLPTDTMRDVGNGRMIGKEDLEQIQASAGRPAMGLGGTS